MLHSLNNTQLFTERFSLRPLTKHDASLEYLSWFVNEGAENINVADSMKSLRDLELYILEKSSKIDVWFLGIFTKEDGLHVGNIKFEPVNSSLGYSILGLLVGRPEYRGKGVAGEVIKACGILLRDNYAITHLLLGVLESNTSAIKAYEKAGFVITKTRHISSVAGVLKMQLETEQLGYID